MLELVHTIIYSYNKHSVIDEKFYINDKELTMYQFYNLLNNNKYLARHQRMNRAIDGTIYAELYRSN